MTSQPSTFHAGRQGQSAGRVRLELDAADAEADGVGWPHSRDVVAELTDLFAALQLGFGPIRRVIYHPDVVHRATRIGGPRRTRSARRLTGAGNRALSTSPESALP